MKLDPKVTNIVEKVFADDILMKNDIEFLLRIPEHSIEAGFIMASADVVSRSASNNKAEVHAQIGLNISSCTYNCEFCAFAEKYKIFEVIKLDIESWDADKCPLCDAGSKALRPKENWKILNSEL